MIETAVIVVGSMIVGSVVTHLSYRRGQRKQPFSSFECECTHSYAMHDTEQPHKCRGKTSHKDHLGVRVFANCTCQHFVGTKPFDEIIASFDPKSLIFKSTNDN